MKFYKLDENSHSYIKSDNSSNDNVFVDEDVMLWADDVAKMNNLDVKVDNIEIAIEVLDRHGEYLTRIV